MCDPQNETNPAATNHGIRAVVGVATALSTAVTIQAATRSGNTIGMHNDPAIGFHVGLHVDEAMDLTAHRVNENFVAIALGDNGVPDRVYLTPTQARQLLDQLTDLNLDIELAEPAVAVA